MDLLDVLWVAFYHHLGVLIFDADGDVGDQPLLNVSTAVCVLSPARSRRCRTESKPT